MFTIRSTLPPVPTGRIERARAALEREIGPSKVLSSSESCERFQNDESEAEGRIPDLVVLAESPEHVRAALKVAEQYEVPLTPRGGGTGRTGGAVPLRGGIVLATVGMNKIKEIDRTDLLVVVEPGVVLCDLHAAVEKEGLFYPPDPNSLENCVLGGNLAENAGGPRAFRYGSTRDYVLGLDVVLMGGQRLRTGRRTIKGVAGYDITATLVGSEGTLGVFTEATLKLIPKPPAVATVLALYDTAQRAAGAVSAIVERGVVPRCLEFVDSGALEAIRSQGVGIDERAGSFLLVEVDGDEESCERDMLRVGEACEASQALEVLVAQNASQRDRLWAARRELSPAVRRLAKNKLAEDVVVPRSEIPSLLDEVDRIADRYSVRMLVYGHAGDGNLHVNFLWDEDDDVARVTSAIEQMFRAVVAMRGTISGEHGIGVLKRKYLGLEQSPELIALERKVKSVFDPRGLLNPGKIFEEEEAC